MGSSEDFLEYLKKTRFGFRHLLKAFADQCTLSFGFDTVHFGKEYQKVENNLNQYLEGEDPVVRGLKCDNPADEMRFLADTLGDLDVSLVTLVRGSRNKGASGLSLFIRRLQGCLNECEKEVRGSTEGELE